MEEDTKKAERPVIIENWYNPGFTTATTRPARKLVTHPRYYVLNGKEAVPFYDTLEWARSFESTDRIVAKTMVEDIEISTVFLGLDHSFFEGGPPLIFETMIFGGSDDQWMDRYSTWDEAEEGHKKAVEMVRERVKSYSPYTPKIELDLD